LIGHWTDLSAQKKKILVDVVGDVVGKTSRTTLTKYMDELVHAKVLTPKKKGTEIYYLNDDLIRILEG